MIKAAPWSIKGIDFDARDAAREAAEKEGMSLGEWLREVISERAAEVGVDVDDFDDDDRAEAVSSRLARMRDGRRRADRRPSRDDDRYERRRRARRPSRGAREREVSWRDGEAETLLEDAIEAFEERVHRSQEKTQRALDEVADLVEGASARGARETHLLKSISKRLADIETRVAPGAAPAPVRATRADTEAEPARARESQAGLNVIDAKLSEIARQLDRDPAAVAPEGDRLARIEKSIADLATQMEKGAAFAAPGRRPLVDAVSQIAQRQRELDGGDFLPARRGEPRPPFDMRRAPLDLDATLTGLQGDIARMAQHLEKMRDESSSRGGATSDASLDRLRSEILAVSRGLGDLAPRSAVTAMERSLRDMAERLETMSGGGSAEQIARELRAGMRELDLRPAIGALEQDMRGIAAKLDSLEMRGGVDPQTVRAIYDQTREVRDLLARAATASLPGARAQRELADIAERIERNGNAGVAPADVARIVADIRAVVSEGLGAEGLRALENRIESLSQRIDSALSGASGGPGIAAIGERLDKLHRAVAQSLAAPRAQAPADTQHLEDLVRDLAHKLDRAADPQAGRDDLLSLQQQIENLSSKIERSNGRDETVVSLERMIGDLFGQLNETRAAAFEAAENAARSAVREAMSSGAVAAPREEIGREIADLRQIQDTSDQRTHATLKAVHETLERVVDRLATLEGEIGEPRAPRAPAPEAAPPPPTRPPGVSTPVAAALARKKGAPQVDAPRAAQPDSQAGREPDILIEPGAARNRRPSIPLAGSAPAADEAGEKTAQASFIAAARRAALAAQAATASAEGEEAEHESEAVAGGGVVARARGVLERRRKPILLSLAALVGLLGALQIASVYLESRQAPPPAPVVRPAGPAKSDEVKPQSMAPDARKAPLADNAATNAGASNSTNAGAPLVTPKAPDQSSSDQSPPKSPSASLGQPSASTIVDAPDAADAKKVDPAPVGSIAKKVDDSPAVMAAIEAAAARGDAAAQYELGARRADGNQIARDLKGAAEMFERSATKGFAPAQYRLGVMYERGLGVARDPALAKLWYQRAADRGNVRAMHNIAVILADGDGKPDYSGAAKWFRRAAEHGVRDSQYNLAILYARGMGGPQDLVQSYAWFAAAASQGDEDAAKKRDEIGAKLDAVTLARAKGMAAAYRPRSVDPAVNEVTPPPGGWQALQPPPKNEDKAAPTGKPKVSRL
ncbi:MAG: hypothetical protein U1E28_06075 [Beijerinckiaceae bacterium]